MEYTEVLISEFSGSGDVITCAEGITIDTLSDVVALVFEKIHFDPDLNLNIGVSRTLTHTGLGSVRMTGLSPDELSKAANIMVRSFVEVVNPSIVYVFVPDGTTEMINIS